MSDLTPPSADPRCGTYAGVGVHYRRGERSCAQCRRAAAEYGRQRPSRKAERKTVLPVAIDLDGQGICARPEYRDNNLWDEPQTGETVAELRSRWAHAQILCHACPVLAQCGQMGDPRDRSVGVWAGRIPPLPKGVKRGAEGKPRRKGKRRSNSTQTPEAQRGDPE